MFGKVAKVLNMLGFFFPNVLCLWGGLFLRIWVWKVWVFLCFSFLFFFCLGFIFVVCFVFVLLLDCFGGCSCFCF